MKSLVLIFVICVGIAVGRNGGPPEIKEEENVLVLTDKNFDYVVTNNKHVLVEFYAPWCGHCKALAPEYAKAATSLKEQEVEIKLAKVDATVETAMAKKFGVRGYPTLKFFRGGKPSEYKGGRKADDIISWIKKKTGPPCKVLSSNDEVNSFKSDNEVAVIGHFANAEDANAKNYEDVAGGIDDLPFGIVFDSAVAEAVEVPINTVTIFKQFDEGRADYDGDLSDGDAMVSFIKGNQLRLVTEFTQESAPRIFGGDIAVHNLMFISKTSGDFEKHYEAFKQAAADFKGKVLFIFIDIDKNDNKRVMEFFGLTGGDMPQYRIIKMSDNMAKFKPDTMDLSKDAVVQFTNEVLDGKVKRHLMSQEIPDDWDKNPVTVLVGKNFKEVVFDESKKVFIEFYAPWCGHCKQLKPIWEKLGEQFKDDKDVVIAMMDATANEVDGFQITGFPTLKFVPSGSDKVLDYRGDRTVEAMAEYVNSNGKKVGEDDAGEEEVDQERPTTSPLPPLETGGGRNVPDIDPKKVEESMDPSMRLDNIKEKMREELAKVDEDLKKKQKQEL